jgi:riboflavin synthase
MFSGIIETIGKVTSIEDRNGDQRISIDAAGLDLSDVEIGHSIAINGVCLTVVNIADNKFSVDVSAETLSCTTFNQLKTGSKVNLERALKLYDRIHGHLVAGHVDGVGTVKSRQPEARSEKFEIDCPPDLLRYVSKKGSICIDGVSLTVNEKTATGFLVNVIPHTLEGTIISGYQPGTRVNQEVDLVARYLESLITPA